MSEALEAKPEPTDDPKRDPETSQARVKSDTSEPESPTPKKKGGGTLVRFVSALPLIPLVLWLMFGAPKVAFAIFGFVWIGITAHELMVMTQGRARLARFWGVLASVGFAVALRYGDPRTMPMVTVLSILGAMVVGLTRPDPVEGAHGRLGWLIGGPLYVGGTLGLLAVLHQHDHGGSWVLLSMFIAFLSDTGAYFAGKNFGRHKLYPKLSPKKTIEGSLGGLVTAALGAVGLSYTLLAGQLPLVDGILLAFVAGAFGQAGDLFESLLKRSTGVKDSGNILPGHGGLLDRSDALMLTGTMTWLYVEWILPLRG